ncbi:MAG: hypothetical protein INH41_27330 [Myxococcaceae bacterium]|jgi:hypothetical protein|nr:hypothetical protein [Myxococcaceae bacterium]
MTMDCDAFERQVLEGSLTPEAEGHQQGCASCWAFARDVGVLVSAAAPALSHDERAALDRLEADTWRALPRPRPKARPSWLGYAAAAGLGALVTSAGFMAARPVREVVVERLVSLPAPVAELDPEEPNLVTDEVFFDVTWPDFSEGETR